MTLRTERDQVLQRWPGDWMNLVADGQELLISVLRRSGKGLHQAVWTRSPYLVWSFTAHYMPKSCSAGCALRLGTTPANASSRGYFFFNDTASTEIYPLSLLYARSAWLNFRQFA